MQIVRWFPPSKVSTHDHDIRRVQKWVSTQWRILSVEPMAELLWLQSSGIVMQVQVPSYGCGFADGNLQEVAVW